jgi:hypothetical protein
MLLFALVVFGSEFVILLNRKKKLSADEKENSWIDSTGELGKENREK